MTTHYKGRPDEVIALDTFIKLSRAAESFDVRVARHCSLEDLTLTQFAVLEALHHLGPLSQTELGAKLLKSGGNITLVIDNLQKYGYVERKRCVKDRRLIYVSLTHEGKEKIARIFPLHAQAITQEMAVLTEQEQQQLGQLLRKLGRAEMPAESPCDELTHELEHRLPQQTRWEKENDVPVMAHGD